MYATERHELIERVLDDDGRVSVVDLARRFDVTTETIRRDLDVLERGGVLRRVHGGAVAAGSGSIAESPVSERMAHQAGAKEAIARRALAAVGPGFHGSIYLDAGSTTAAIAALLPAHLDEVGAVAEVVTHSMTIAHGLAGVAGISLSVIGGRVRGVTAAAVGAETVRTIEALRPDVAFVGTNGVSADFGLSTPDPDEAAVKGAIVRVARRAVVVADAEKLGAELLVRFGALDDIDVLVTDGTPDAELVERLDAGDVEVWAA